MAVKPTAYMQSPQVSYNNPGSPGMLVSASGILLGTDDQPVAGFPSGSQAQATCNVGDDEHDIREALETGLLSGIASWTGLTDVDVVWLGI